MANDIVPHTQKLSRIEDDQPRGGGYTIADIQRMRSAVESEYSYRKMGGGNSYSYDPKERILEIEERLRTYIAAGIRPEEVESLAHKSAEQHFFVQDAAMRYSAGIECYLLAGHAELKKKYQRPKIAPQSHDIGSRDCSGCRYHSSALAGTYWDRCYNEQAARDSEGQRARCQVMRLPLQGCGMSGKWFRPEKPTDAEADYLLSQLSTNAVRALIWGAGFTGNSFSGGPDFDDKAVTRELLALDLGHGKYSYQPTFGTAVARRLYFWAKQTDCPHP